jgi:hypothetical protein
MEAAKTISFSIENDIYLPEVKPNGDDPGQAEEKFGSDFGQTFCIRRPTIGDEDDIASLHTAACLARGVSDPAALPTRNYVSGRALFFFAVLGATNGDKAMPELRLSVPPWCASTAEASPKLRDAIVRAYEKANELLGNAKKKPASNGSAGSSPA